MKKKIVLLFCVIPWPKVNILTVFPEELGFEIGRSQC
jgi:hypothetical protein